MLIQIVKTDREDFLNVVMENNPEKYKLLMYILQDLGCIIQRYYWRSKLDETYIEYLEPKIYDVFDFTLDCIGTSNQFNEAIKIYNERVKLRENLFIVSPLSQEEIKNYSMKVLNSL